MNSESQGRIRARALTSDRFAGFGEVFAAGDGVAKTINRGRCQRYSDWASLAFLRDGRASLSLFESEPVALPLKLDFLERHPLGTQAFIPMSGNPYLVVVAPGLEDGSPGLPEAFVAGPGQCINIGLGVWHGVLSPIGKRSVFAVVDRAGPGDNVEEFELGSPCWISLPHSAGH